MEIGLFIDQHLIGGKPLPVLETPAQKDGKVRVAFRSESKPVSAALRYTTGSEPINKRTWQTIPASLENGAVITPAPPAETTAWFFTLTDERQAVVSCSVVLGK